MAVPSTAPRAPAKRRALWLVLAAPLVFVLLWWLLGLSHGEILYRLAQRRYAQLAPQLAAASPEAVQETIAAYVKVVDEAPGTLWAVKALWNLGRWHAAQGEWTQARQWWARIEREYDRFADDSMAALVAVAQAYEKEGRWSEARQTYLQVMGRHPGSAVWLEAPLYLGQMYERQGEPAHARQAYQEAVKVFEERLSKMLMPKVEKQLRTHLAYAQARLQALQ